MATQKNGTQEQVTIESLQWREMGMNVDIARDGNVMYIRVDTTRDFGLSSSGKTHTVASTGGFVKFPDGIMVGLNVNKK